MSERDDIDIFGKTLPAASPEGNRTICGVPKWNSGGEIYLALFLILRCLNILNPE